MTGRTLKAGMVIAGFILAASPAHMALAAEDSWTHPQTEWGAPDLQGKWPVGHLTGLPLERPEEYGNREFLTDEEYQERLQEVQAANQRYEREIQDDKLGMGHWTEKARASRRTSLIMQPEDGQLPEMTEEGKRRSDQMRSSWQDIEFDSVEDFDTWDRCITRGMPASMLAFRYNNGIQILQSPGYVVIRLEMIHETRIIPTDGRAALPSKIQNWMGESRGHWDGNTLVVETTNFRPGPSATNIGVVGSPPENDTPISSEATIVERFTRTSEDEMLYEMTLDDPVVFTEPWTVKADWIRDPGYEFFEYACTEDNYTIRDYITASRAKREKAEEE